MELHEGRLWQWVGVAAKLGKVLVGKGGNARIYGALASIALMINGTKRFHWAREQAG